jgi:lipid A 3-O-deacylase
VEKGADLNAELLFVSPAPPGWGDGMPNWLRWVARPRPHVGASLNTAGATSQAYAGLTWTATLWRGVARDDDPVLASFAFGGAVNNGYANAPRPDRKDLGSNVLFRLGFEIGYQVTPRIGVHALLDHESNGGLAARNRALNNVGLRLSYRF